ncbi:MAG TPA: hypothetical protein PKI11_09150, partial [Candidatus Hydrogenedentes bacterium]|nr:hypothetical protein [Candidatus Hydrogenedentota bacterium]
MPGWFSICVGVIALLALTADSAHGQTPERDYTCFQTASPYTRELDIASDMAVVYGVGGNFAERAAG